MSSKVLSPSLLQGLLRPIAVVFAVFTLSVFQLSHASLALTNQLNILIEKWPGDIETAFQYLESQRDVARDVIGVGGASCGVNNSILAGRRHAGEVKSLVLLSGGTNFAGRQFLRDSSQLPVLFAVVITSPKAKTAPSI